jgi:uncharacterized protein (DUF58 family)
VYPTRTTVHLVLGAILMMAAGVAAREMGLMGFGLALLLGIEAARSAAVIGLSRARAAGLEMSWRTGARSVRGVRGRSIVLRAELRNRHPRAIHFSGLRAVASSALAVSVEPQAGVLPAGGSLPVRLHVTPRRTGRHGVHGLTVEVVPLPGLFQAALAFGNPLGIEVLPAPLSLWLGSARGGRARHATSYGATASQRPGEGLQIRELRDYVPGDPMKRIAWKASARRGRLIARELEHDEREVIWLVLDASVELLGGEEGRAPLDLVIDELASTARRHLSRGDRVGLAVAGGMRPLAWILPASGPAQGTRLVTALLEATATADADRSELDEADVSRRVIEHAALLDPRRAARLDPRELDRVAATVEPLLARAPFLNLAPPLAAGTRERLLRRYLASFGIASPARSEPEALRTQQITSRLLEQIASHRERASSVVLFSICNGPPGASLVKAIQRLRHRGTSVAMRSVEVEGAARGDLREPERSAAVVRALARRARLARARGERHLRHLGVRILRRATIEAP